MTCLEKWKKAHPDCQDTDEIVNERCPDFEEIMDKPIWCGGFEGENCRQCWDREVPDVEEKSGLQVTMEKIQECVIKDSGERRQFDTGAVRDIQEGKGRCDLMPLDVVAQVLGDRGDDRSYDVILDDLDLFQRTGDVEGLYYAVARFAEAMYGSTYTMLFEVAKHFEDGAKKYGENNWQKGIPVRCYIDSAVRHYLKYLRGDKDEPHDRAFCWNILCAIWTCNHKPELNDYNKEETEE